MTWFAGRIPLWVPEVKAQVVYLGVMELLGPEGFLAQAKHADEVLFSSPLYRILFAKFLGTRSLNLIAATWQRFRKGSSLTVTSRREGSIELIIQAPKDLFVPTMMEALSIGCITALEVCGVENAEVLVREQTPSSFAFQLAWSF